MTDQDGTEMLRELRQRQGYNKDTGRQDDHDSVLHPDNAIGTMYDRESYEAGQRAERERLEREVRVIFDVLEGKGVELSYYQAAWILAAFKANILERGRP